MKTINDYAELVKEKHALNKTIAPVETDLTDASRGYHIGEQFIYDGELYKAKTEIAQHDALVLNTNYEPSDNLTEQIKNAGGGTGTDPRLDVFEKNIASVETDETDASQPYQVGEQLILNNILYDVIAPISEHDVITTTGSGANIAPADPISSQFEALTNEVKDMNNVLGSKNLLPISLSYLKSINTDGTWNGNAYTVDSVTYTVNTDSQGNITDITTSGTASSNSALNIYGTSTSYGENNFSGMILNGCPSGGGTAGTDYRIVAFIGNSQDGTGHNTINDTGDGVTLTNASYLRIYLRIPNGYSSSLVFKPMIRLASITDDTYEPYAKTNQQLTQDTTALLDNLEVNGAVNILPNKATTQTVNGITFTVNDDGTITIDGTASARTGFISYQENAEKWLKQNTAYKATVGNSVFDGSTSQDCFVQLFREGSPYPLIATFNGSEFIVPASYFNISQRLAVQTVIKEGVTVTNQTIKPLIARASYNGDYVPYAKSNKELTDELKVTTGQIARLVSFSSLTAYIARKYGKVVELYFAGTLSEAVNTWTDFLTVPDGFRPSHYVQIVSFNTYNSCKNLQLAPSGGIQAAYNLAAGDFIRFTVTYIID